jgi:hypothetical protein
MYATPSIKPVPMSVGASSCCTISFTSETTNVPTIHNPACGTVIKQFPTCSPVFNGLCTISVATSHGTLTISGQ